MQEPRGTFTKIVIVAITETKMKVTGIEATAKKQKNHAGASNF